MAWAIHLLALRNDDLVSFYTMFALVSAHWLEYNKLIKGSLLFMTASTVLSQEALNAMLSGYFTEKPVVKNTFTKSQFSSSTVYVLALFLFNLTLPYFSLL